MTRITIDARVPVAEYPKPQRVQTSLQKLWHRVLCHRHPLEAPASTNQTWRPW